MTARAIIVALRPQWARAIAAGEKELEFRRVWSRQPAPYDMYIYETLPVGALTSIVTVDAIHRVSGSTIASLQARFRFNNTASRVLDYVRGDGHALELSAHRALPRSIPLADLRALGFTPPQNYAYLDTYPQLQAILKR